MTQDTIQGTDYVSTALLTKVNGDITELFAVQTEVVAARDGESSLLVKINAIDTTLAAVSAGSGVTISANDTTVGVLNGKAVAGIGVTFTENNDGAAETLTIAVGSYVSTNDTTNGALNGKLVAGSNITFTENNDGAAETLTIAVTSTAAIPTMTGNSGKTIGTDGSTASWSYYAGHSSQTLACADPTGDTHAVNRLYGDGRYIYPYMLATDVKSVGTHAGTSTAGANTRVLNTAVNTITGASLGSNQITLPAGTYNIRATAPCVGGANHKAYLYNVTDAAIAINGTSEYSDNSTSTSTCSVCVGRVVIASAKVFELRHAIQISVATNGLGIACNVAAAGSEVYSTVMIQKEYA